jgi:hypothetical protein
MLLAGAPAAVAGGFAATILIAAGVAGVVVGAALAIDALT